MGVCYLQRRIVTGKYNQRGICISNNITTILRMICEDWEGWMQFLKPCITSVSLFIYTLSTKLLIPKTIISKIFV